MELALLVNRAALPHSPFEQAHAEVVQAFTREDYEEKRFESESLANVEAGLQARGTKAKLAPLVSVILAIAVTSFVAYISFRLIEVPMVAFGKVHEPLLRSSIKRVRAKLGLLNQA
jgi:hypothetical protein